MENLLWSSMPKHKNDLQSQFQTEHCVQRTTLPHSWKALFVSWSTTRNLWPKIQWLGHLSRRGGRWGGVGGWCSSSTSENNISRFNVKQSCLGVGSKIRSGAMTRGGAAKSCLSVNPHQAHYSSDGEGRERLPSLIMELAQTFLPPNRPSQTVYMYI